MERSRSADAGLGLGHADPVPSPQASPKKKMVRWIPKRTYSVGLSGAKTEIPAKTEVLARSKPLFLRLEYMMIITLGHTTNFTYLYQDNFADAKRRAQALMATCEADFSQCQKLFGVTGGFGTSNRVTLRVDQASLANNNRYHTDGSMLIVMNPFDGSAQEDLADDGVRALFIAEFVEVLMSYRNYKTGTATWNEAASDGEGLSHVLAAFFYDDAYYKILGGPFINSWLQSTARKDWISTTESSDTDIDSFGCSILFIYYLYSQLGYAMDKIITQAGTTLEATYQVLTGKSGGYAAMTQFLAPYFPIGQTPSLPFDDPFPLGNPRTVSISFQESGETPKPVSSGSATISPGFGCPAKTYHWTLSNVSQGLTCTAAVSGFGQPVYQWYINGQKVPFTGTDTFSATVLEDDPSNPDHPKSSVKSVQLYWETPGSASSYRGLAGLLVIYNESFDGHVLLDVAVDVNEKYASSNVTSGSSVGTIDTQVLTYEDQYYKDRLACLETLRINLSRQFKPPQPLPSWVFVLLNLPDPPPEVLIGIQVLVQLAAEIEQIAARDSRLAHQITQVFSSLLNMPQQWLLTGQEGRADAGRAGGPTKE